MKRVILSLVVVLFLLGGCVMPVRENDPDNLAQLPYTFSGSSGDWEVTVEFRELNEADHALIEKMQQEGTELEGDLSNGYRSAVKIRYTGNETITSLSYTFGLHTQWSSLIKVTEKETEMPLSEALNGEVELGGNFYSADGSVGGPLPPKGYNGLQVMIDAVTDSGATLNEKVRIYSE
jgi:hypothetical protein